MKAYYNEHDKQAAAWLRELIKQKVITDGVVDERSIEDVLPAELAEFDRCHFFAGIGVWDYALTQAGWPDDGPIWTGSCPCQPFSAAGKGEGFDDERHLWPAWFHLIEVCRPDSIFGEQVSSVDGITWLDLVYADLEGIDYTVGALDIPAASVGAPHRRQRLYFVADALGRGCGPQGIGRRISNQLSAKWADKPLPVAQRGPTDRLENPVSDGRRGRGNGNPAGNGGQIQVEGRGSSGRLDNATDARRQTEGEYSGRQSLLAARSVEPGGARGLALTNGRNPGTERIQRGGQHGQQPQDGGTGELADSERGRRDGAAIHLPVGQTRDAVSLPAGRGPTNGFWGNAEWIFCRDEKYRPVEPGTFPLVTGAAARVGRLRGYGNSINAENAVAFIESYLMLSF